VGAEVGAVVGGEVGGEVGAEVGGNVGARHSLNQAIVNGSNGSTDTARDTKPNPWLGLHVKATVTMAV
jgi:hypothetical protein